MELCVVTGLMSVIQDPHALNLNLFRRSHVKSNVLNCHKHDEINWISNISLYFYLFGKKSCYTHITDFFIYMATLLRYSLSYL